MTINIKVTEVELQKIKNLMEDKIQTANQAEAKHDFLLKELQTDFGITNLDEAYELVSDITSDKDSIESEIVTSLAQLKKEIEKTGLLHD